MKNMTWQTPCAREISNTNNDISAGGIEDITGQKHTASVLDNTLEHILLPAEFHLCQSSCLYLQSSSFSCVLAPLFAVDTGGLLFPCHNVRPSSCGSVLSFLLPFL